MKNCVNLKAIRKRTVIDEVIKIEAIQLFDN